MPANSLLALPERINSWRRHLVASAGTTSGFHIACSRECPQPDKYRKDALIRTNALHNEKDEFLRSRLTFHLAQCYRGAGEKDKALRQP